MEKLVKIPLDQTIANWWNTINLEYKRAFLFVFAVSLLAFGFEMSNLTLHHDDVSQFFIQDTILGHYVGRFGLGWLNYYGQSAYFMPFLQMLEGIFFMSMYGLFVARFWGAQNTMDIVLVASILSVFPYMAQVYQYNTAMATYSLAHFLAAAALILSTRASFLYIAIAAFLYAAAFSIYQTVIASAATIFVVWALINLLFRKEGQNFFNRAVVSSTIAALVSVGLGGLLYLAAVSSMDMKLDSHQAANQAFSIKEGFNLSYAVSAISDGSRSFFFWPEHYFPVYLKNLQLVFLVSAGILCIWLPRSIGGKVGAVVMLIVGSLAPRLLQLLHPEGNYHSLTLTAYAVLIAGTVMIINKAGHVLLRNLSIILAFFLIGGYILQCNWISTVNYLNTLAHYTTLTQVLSRIRSLPEVDWDGKKIAVVGSLDLPSDYPYKNATGVANEFMDAKHMQHLANLMRDNVQFISADSKTPEALEYAATHPIWPHPKSVGVVKGTGIVVLSKDNPQSK